jgi:hypothetical protein
MQGMVLRDRVRPWMAEPEPRMDAAFGVSRKAVPCSRRSGALEQSLRGSPVPLIEQRQLTPGGALGIFL